MVPNHTNQLPLYLFNQKHPVDPPPRYSRSDSRRLGHDFSSVFLCALFAFCVLALLFLIVIGLVLVRIQLDHVVASCTATPVTNWRIPNSTTVEVDCFFSFLLIPTLNALFRFQIRSQILRPPAYPHPIPVFLLSSRIVRTLSTFREIFWPCLSIVTSIVFNLLNSAANPRHRTQY